MYRARQTLTLGSLEKARHLISAATFASSMPFPFNGFIRLFGDIKSLLVFVLDILTIIKHELPTLICGVRGPMGGCSGKLTHQRAEAHPQPLHIGKLKG